MSATTAGRQVLTVICAECGRSFASAIQMDAPTWEAIRMSSGLMERCPHCGRSTLFSKSDYVFLSA
jgi:hypothetical protein